MESIVGSSPFINKLGNLKRLEMGMMSLGDHFYKQFDIIVKFEAAAQKRGQEATKI